MKKLENISGIPYETDVDDEFEKHPRIPNSVWNMRAMPTTSTDFEQVILTGIYGDDFIKGCKKVLEIGCGIGRNAQHFMDKTSAHYYGFDTSETSLKYFREMGFPEDRYYISREMDETILEQEYDFVFSTYVLNHIGFSKDNIPDDDIHDSVSIADKLWPTLKKNGYWMSFELHQGQNKWHPDRWHKECFLDKNKSHKLLHTAQCKLDGCEPINHHLYVIQKI